MDPDLLLLRWLGHKPPIGTIARRGASTLCHHRQSQVPKAFAAAKLAKQNEARKVAIKLAQRERRARNPALAKKARAEAVKKERVAREKAAAAKRMAAKKALYTQKMKIKQDQFKLDKKIAKNYQMGKTTRI